MKRMAASCTAVLCAGVIAMSGAESIPVLGGITASAEESSAEKTAAENTAAENTAAEKSLPDSESVYSLTAEKAEQGVYLKWEAVPDAFDYVIYRARCGEDGELIGKFKKVAVARGNEYNDKSARGGKGKMYVYKICPRFRGSGAPVRGEFSGEVYSYAGVIVHDDYGVECGAGVDYDGDYEEDAVCYAPTEDDISVDEEADYDEDIGYDDDADYSYSEITAGTLTAGEWRDNRKFNEYRKLAAEKKWKDEYAKFGIKTSRMHKVTVTDSKGECAANALVSLKSGGRVLGKARTDNKGVAYVYYNIYGRNETPSILEVSSGSERRRIRISKRETCRSFNVSLKGEVAAPEKSLDLMFMIDTTGSMSDELEYLQAEFLDVIARVDEANPDLSKRASMNFYRDHGDDYVIRSFEFTDDMQKASKQLSAQEAHGGGDYPEAVDEALENAVNGHKWREDSVKIMFMVLDAPAHSSEEITRSLVRSAKTASAKGIRIIPIVSSGAEFDVEYLMRSMAVITGGTYVFLTDDSGVGYSHLAPTLSEDYDKEKLNELMIRVINGYLE